MFRRKAGKVAQPPASVYEGLRTAALEAGTVLVDTPRRDHPDVLGVVVDIPGDGGIATVVALADDTTSMYTSTGGGTIGAGQHDAVAHATNTLLTAISSRIDLFPSDERTDLPRAEFVQITVLTPSGRRRASIPSAAFWGREPSTVADVIAAIHNVISAMHTIQST